VSWEERKSNYSWFPIVPVKTIPSVVLHPSSWLHCRFFFTLPEPFSSYPLEKKALSHQLLFLSGLKQRPFFVLMGTRTNYTVSSLGPSFASSTPSSWLWMCHHREGQISFLWGLGDTLQGPWEIEVPADYIHSSDVWAQRTQLSVLILSLSITWASLWSLIFLFYLFSSLISG
jgi:hypothetical protein